MRSGAYCLWSTVGPSIWRAAQRDERCNRVGGIEAPTVVWIDKGQRDASTFLDDIGRRHRQRPAIVPVAYRQVVACLHEVGLDRRAELEANAERVGEPAAFVGQHREGEIVLLSRGERVV